MNRRTILQTSAAFAGFFGVGGLDATADPVMASDATLMWRPTGPLDAVAEAKNLAYDRFGKGETIVMISGFPSTRRSWYRLIPWLAQNYQCIPTDLPSFGGSGLLNAPASTENVARVFHEFVTTKFEPPVHVVAHDFGAWCAYSWQLLFPKDFKTLTLIEAGIPGITLPPTIEVSDYKRKWNFIFMMVPDLPAELVHGKTIETRPLFVLREAVAPLLVVGETPNGYRRVGLVQGGSFDGDRLSGVVVSGNDWQTIRPDSCMKLDVRLVLRTADDALITMRYTVVRAGAPDVMAAMDRGEAPDPSTYYFRMVPFFETSAKQYDWINRIVCVGVGNRLADGPVYSVFEVL